MAKRKNVQGQSRKEHQTIEAKRRAGRLAGHAADDGHPEEYAGFPGFGEAPVWEASLPNRDESASKDHRQSPLKFKLLSESGEKTFALIFEKEHEVVGALRRFAIEQRLLASHFNAIGAFRDIVVGFFDRDTKKYKRITITEQVEVLSLTGDITVEGDSPKIHAHVVVGKSDGTAHGGHLIEGHVFPTLEMILVESPKYLQRRLDKETGLALIDLDAA